MREKDRPKHLFIWLQQWPCFVLCFREEGPRAVTALYFGWPAFRNRHFVLGGRGGGCPPPVILIPAFHSTRPIPLHRVGLGRGPPVTCNIAERAWRVSRAGDAEGRAQHKGTGAPRSVLRRSRSGALGALRRDAGAWDGTWAGGCAGVPPRCRISSVLP